MRKSLFKVFVFICCIGLTFSAQAQNIDAKLGGATSAQKFVVTDNAGTPDTLFMVRGDGNVGIGDTSPTYKLDVAGKIGINDTQILYLPDQTDFEGTLILGTGGGSLSHSSGDQGRYNTAIGISALNANTTGKKNTASGYQALYFNTSGDSNMASGHEALYCNISGNSNTASGYQALYSNEYGDYNTASGNYALYCNTDGNENTASGRYALCCNTDGDYNTASGYDALYENSSGNYNTASGYQALTNTLGNYNTASGSKALYSNGTGDYNTALGYYADVTTTNLTNATAIGYNAKVNDSHKVRVGDGNVTVCEAQVAWSNPSDARLKKNIKDSNLGLEFIKKLRPITYNMKKGHEGIQYVGFIAQEVEQATKELGVDFDGVNKPPNEEEYYSLAYSKFTVPLVKAVQQQQQIIENQQNFSSTVESCFKIFCSIKTTT